MLYCFCILVGFWFRLSVLVNCVLSNCLICFIVFCCLWSVLLLCDFLNEVFNCWVNWIFVCCFDSVWISLSVWWLFLIVKGVCWLLRKVGLILCFFIEMNVGIFWVGVLNEIMDLSEGCGKVFIKGKFVCIW